MDFNYFYGRGADQFAFLSNTQDFDHGSRKGKSNYGSIETFWDDFIRHLLLNKFSQFYNNITLLEQPVQKILC